MNIGDQRAVSAGHLRKAALFATKLAVTGICFWYIMRQVDPGAMLKALPQFEPTWITLALLVLTMQFAVLGLRWRAVLLAMGANPPAFSRRKVVAISFIGSFFSQVIPAAAGEGMRAWLATRLGCGWKTAIVSVLIDRVIAVIAMVALSFIILLVPSELSAFAGYRAAILILYGCSLVLAACLFLLSRPVLALLARSKHLLWIAKLMHSCKDVLVGRFLFGIFGLSVLMHVSTVFVIVLLGRAQGMELSIMQGGVLFVAMIGVAVLPISVGGWGLREVAVVSLLSTQGIGREHALLFSMSFGVLLILATLPGLFLWLVFRVPNAGLSAYKAPPAGIATNRL